jgi:hypothetical protein
MAMVLYPDPIERAQFVRAADVANTMGKDFNLALQNIPPIMGEESKAKREAWVNARSRVLTAVGEASTKDNVPSKRAKDTASEILTDRNLTPQQKKEEIKNLLNLYDVHMDVLEKVGLW